MNDFRLILLDHTTYNDRPSLSNSFTVTMGCGLGSYTSSCLYCSCWLYLFMHYYPTPCWDASWKTKMLALFFLHVAILISDQFQCVISQMNWKDIFLVKFTIIYYIILCRCYNINELPCKFILPFFFCTVCSMYFIKFNNE